VSLAWLGAGAGLTNISLRANLKESVGAAIEVATCITVNHIARDRLVINVIYYSLQ
jgi:hypothetical protein